MADTSSSARRQIGVEGGRPDKTAGAAAVDRPQISVCSEISRASSTSMPRYLTVDFRAWPEVHRLDYVRLRPMKRTPTPPTARPSRRPGHSPEPFTGLQERQQLVVGPVPSWLAVRRRRLVQQLLLELQIGVQADLRRLDRLVAKPQREDRCSTPSCSRSIAVVWRST